MTDALPYSERRLVALFTSYLDHAADAEAGDAFYDLHAPEALLVVGDRVIPAHGVDRADFAEIHRAQARPFEPALVDLAVTRVHDQDERAVVWLTGFDGDGGTPVVAAIGVVRHGAEIRLAWATLATEEAPWSFAHGRQMTAAEYPMAKNRAAGRWRTAIEVAFHRLHAHPAPALLTLPEARFSCHSGTACCKSVFGIELDASAQAFIDQVDWETIRPELAGTQLPVLESGKLQLREENERCRFMDEHQHCLIHKAIGRPVFRPCASFPFVFSETPDGVAVSTSFVCGSVRHNLGLPLAERADDLHFRLLHATPFATDTYKLNCDLEVPWESFRDAERALVDLLDRRELPLHRRLWLGSRLLEAWPTGRRSLDPAWEEEPIAPLPEASMIMIQYTVIGVALERCRALLGDRLEPPLPAVSHSELQQPELLAGLLRNLYHSKAFSYSYDLTTSHNLLVILYLVVLHLQTLHPGEALPDAVWRDIGALGSHNGIALFLRLSGAEHHDFFGQAPFGQWLLRYPAA